MVRFVSLRTIMSSCNFYKLLPTWMILNKSVRSYNLFLIRHNLRCSGSVSTSFSERDQILRICARAFTWQRSSLLAKGRLDFKRSPRKDLKVPRHRDLLPCQQWRQGLGGELTYLCIHCSQSFTLEHYFVGSLFERYINRKATKGIF